jgi:DNA-binding MarR family transcriptional regulator
MKKSQAKQLASSNILSLLLNAYYQVDNELQKSLEKKGWRQFTHSQSMIFLNMAEGRDRTVDIAKHIGVSKQAVSRTINELVEIGLIHLETDPNDKRAKRLTLSTKGAVITEDATKSIFELEKNLSKKLGEQKTLQLKELLKALVNQE